MSIPSTQKAWRVLRQGKPADVLELQHDVPVFSELADGEVLVKIKSAALNPVGFKLMKLLPNFLARRPHTAEYDFSGVVVADTETSKYRVGDGVYGQLSADTKYPSKGQGAFAQYISIDSKQLARKPDPMSFDEAAGIALVGRTAIDALIDMADIQPGQHVFINGGSSAVGILGIQIAKAYGCKVTASCSGRNVELVKSLGADEVIDYTVSPPHEAFKKAPPTPIFDVIFDAVSIDNKIYLNSESYLKPDGLYVATTPGVDDKVSVWGLPSMAFELAQTFLQPSILGGVRRTRKVCWARMDGRAMPTLEKLVLEGKVKGVVDSVYPFEDVLKAYERIMTGRASGKVVVQVDV